MERKAKVDWFPSLCVSWMLLLLLVFNNRRCLRAYVFGLDWTCIIKATFNPMEIDIFFFFVATGERKNYPLNLKLTIESALEKNFKNIKEKLFRILFFWMKDLNWIWSWVQDLVTKISISCLDKFIAKLNEEMTALFHKGNDISSIGLNLNPRAPRWLTERYVVVEIIPCSNGRRG